MTLKWSKRVNWSRVHTWHSALNQWGLTYIKTLLPEIIISISLIDAIHLNISGFIYVFLSRWMHYSLRIIKCLNPIGFVLTCILPLLLSSPSLGLRPNSGRASPGSTTSTATSTSCAPVHPWRLTSLRTRRSEPPHRCSCWSATKFPTLSSKNPHRLYTHFHSETE